MPLSPSGASASLLSAPENDRVMSPVGVSLTLCTSQSVPATVLVPSSSTYSSVNESSTSLIDAVGSDSSARVSFVMRRT